MYTCMYTAAMGCGLQLNCQCHRGKNERSIVPCSRKKCDYPVAGEKPDIESNNLAQRQTKYLWWFGRGLQTDSERRPRTMGQNCKRVRPQLPIACPCVKTLSVQSRRCALQPCCGLQCGRNGITRWLTESLTYCSTNRRSRIGPRESCPMYARLVHCQLDGIITKKLTKASGKGACGLTSDAFVTARAVELDTVRKKANTCYYCHKSAGIRFKDKSIEALLAWVDEGTANYKQLCKDC